MDGSALVSEINVQAAANALCDYFHQMPSLSPCVVTLDDLGAPTDVFPFPQRHLPDGEGLRNLMIQVRRLMRIFMNGIAAIA